MGKKLKPQTVTNLGDHTKGYNNRMRNYSIIMAARFICIAAALLIPYPWNIIPIIFAVTSPWFAVLIANNKNVKTSEIEKPTLELE